MNSLVEPQKQLLVMLPFKHLVVAVIHRALLAVLHHF